MADDTPPDLTPPEPVASVTHNQADGMVKLDDATTKALDAKVEEFIRAVTDLDGGSDAFKRKVDSIHSLGNDEIRASAGVSNRMLERPMKSLEDGLFSDTTPVAKSLVNLRKTVEDLDPSRQGDLFAPKKLFGMIPLGNRMRDYFLRYQSSQAHINAILQSLYHGQDELRKDNATIEQEKVNLWNTMQRLKQYAYLGQKIDAALEARVTEIEQQDSDKARVVREEMLFYVRQKVTDLLTQLAVSVQGYLALDLVRKNNLELIKGVDRASTTTVSALRTAVMVAQALTNQKLVLNQITALNTTTGNLIEATSAMLKDQSGKIHEQAAGAGIGIEKLQASFNNIYATMDMISTFKTQALGGMKQTVTVLSREIEQAERYLDRVRREEMASVTNDLKLEPGEGATDSQDEVRL